MQPNTLSLIDDYLSHTHTTRIRITRRAGYGTALGVVRALHETSHLHEVFALETRPYNQVRGGEEEEERGEGERGGKEMSVLKKDKCE